MLDEYYDQLTTNVDTFTKYTKEANDKFWDF